MADNLKVLFLSPEVVPFAKSGGLADVAGSLPVALKRAGVDIRIALPFYRVTREAGFKSRLIIRDLKVPIGTETINADIFETALAEDIPVYLVEREDLYDRSNLYGNSKGDYHDNLERFSFFAHSALMSAQKVKFIPDVIHCHDWQTGIVPALLKGPYGSSPLSGSGTVFTIHNMGYQGLFPREKLPVAGLSEVSFFHPQGLEYWGKISLLKSGIVYSDAITTVSPTYAREIQTPEYGMGMEGVLQTRAASLFGILNGIDYNIWNPETDKHIAVSYSHKKTSGKTRCKKALISEMNLDKDLDGKPLLGIISRLDTQKGFDLLLDILEKIMGLDVGLVVLGSGDEKIETAFNKAVDDYKGKIGIGFGFNDPLAHRIMAGADIFLIPSRYEPCGLTQMYALKYGTIPVVRATGGLNDTIIEFDGKQGNGFKFRDYKSKALLKAIGKAVKLYKDKNAWKKLMANGMKADFSWDRSAKEYLDIYNSIRPRKISL